MRALVLVLLATAGQAAARPDLFSNGPFVTNAGAGAGGANLSAVQTLLQSTMYGANNQQITEDNRVADDFALASASTLTSVVVYGFQTNATTTASTFTSMNLRIWSGRPGDPGSQIVFGDTTTNRLVSAAWANCYRATDTSPTSTNRPIYAIEASITPALNLQPGTYWLDWQVGGTLISGPFAALVTIPGQAGAAGANGRWKQGTSPDWIFLRDSGNTTIQDLAFIIRGSVGGGPTPCYANCDASTSAPVLNALDFSCFLTKFAAGGSYANCDSSTSPPILNALDFSCFLTRFAGGCT